MKQELQHMDKDIEESFQKERARQKSETDRLWEELKSIKGTLNKILWIVITPVIIAIIAGVLKSN
jgi:hypothetical protein